MSVYNFIWYMVSTVGNFILFTDAHLWSIISLGVHIRGGTKCSVAS